MALFERYLDGSAGAARNEENFDHVREGVVVLLGTLARHMTSQDDKVTSERAGLRRRRGHFHPADWRCLLD